MSGANKNAGTPTGAQTTLTEEQLKAAANAVETAQASTIADPAVAVRAGEIKGTAAAAVSSNTTELDAAGAKKTQEVTANAFQVGAETVAKQNSVNQQLTAGLLADWARAGLKGTIVKTTIASWALAIVDIVNAIAPGTFKTDGSFLTWARQTVDAARNPEGVTVDAPVMNVNSLKDSAPTIGRGGYDPDQSFRDATSRVRPSGQAALDASTGQLINTYSPAAAGVPLPADRPSYFKVDPQLAPAGPAPTPP